MVVNQRITAEAALSSASATATLHSNYCLPWALAASARCTLTIVLAGKSSQFYFHTCVLNEERLHRESMTELGGQHSLPPVLDTM